MRLKPSPRLDATPSPEDVERALEALRATLRTEGAARLSTLKPRLVKELLVARLTAEGFELTGSWIRRPVDEQVREAFAHGALLTQKALAGVVRGATSPELKRSIVELERSGEVYRVLRGKSEAFAGAGARVVERESLRALAALIAKLHGALGAANKKKTATLLASDVEEALGNARQLLKRGSANSGAQATATAQAKARPGAAGSAAGQAGAASAREPPAVGGRLPVLDALEALDATRDERTGLSFVPHLVERLLPAVSVATAHQVLLAAARDELIELRPEGGLGRLTSDELRLCPPGPAGTRLSWARRLGAVS